MYIIRENARNLLIAVALSFTSTCWATYSCSKPTLSKVTSSDSIYHFRATEKCTIKDVKIDLAKVKDMYRDEITNKKSQFKVYKQENYKDKNGMQGYSLDATQSYDSDHGPLKVRATILLLDNKTNKFFMELRSKDVAGEGDAQYNHFILNQLDLQVFPDHAELVVTKDIKVEEPWYAPESKFLDTVESELLESIRKASELNAKKISGENVEALRK